MRQMARRSNLFFTLAFVWSLSMIIPHCLGADFGEECDESRPCIDGLVCSTASSSNTCQCPTNLKYIQNACLDTPYGGPCTDDGDCTLSAKCLNFSGNMICIGRPTSSIPSVSVDQYLDESLNVCFNITWEPVPYTGPTYYQVGRKSRDYTQTTGFSHDIVVFTERYKTQLNSCDNIPGGWEYLVDITPKTAAGDGPVYELGPFFGIVGKPGIVRNVKVEQDSSFAEKMKLTFECPSSREINGNITAFIIRKTILTGSQNISTDHTLPYKFLKSKCEVQVEASQVGGIQVLNSYSFEVKIRNSKFEGDFSTPVELFTNVRKPYTSTAHMLEDLISPQKRKAKVEKELPTSFEVKLCSSCFVTSVQGPIKAAAMIICDSTDSQTCPMGSVRVSAGATATKTIESAEDLDLYDTWATANATNFNMPYRTTPDGWFDALLKDNSSSYMYDIGSNNACDPNDNLTFCNGPLPQDKTFIVSIIVCNDAGCDETRSQNYLFNTNASTPKHGTMSVAMMMMMMITMSLVWP